MANPKIPITVVRSTLSFSEGITNSGTFDAGTGGNTGQANYGDVAS